MGKILFITSRNILSTCGELRLIKNRAEILKEEYGYTSDFIAYRISKKKKNEDVGEKLKLYKNPIDRRRLVFTVKKLVSSGRYSCVILSGDDVYFLLPVIKEVHNKCKIILDVHGSIEELVEFRHRNIKEKLIFRPYYKYAKYVEKKYVSLADGILAVSYPLAESYQELSKQRKLKKFIVPCAITVSLSYEEYLNYRKKNRDRYGLADTDKVFIYSGGASPWQCVDETVDLFQKIRQKMGTGYKFLLFSGSKELLEKYTNEDGVIIDSLAPDKVAEILCAGDFGIMLRGDYVTNNVAFPNKFLEYIASGLRVISTPYVYDVGKFIRKYDVGEILELPIREEDIRRICEISTQEYDMKKHFNRRDQLIKECSFEETLRPFIEFIGENG